MCLIAEGKERGVIFGRVVAVFGIGSVPVSVMTGAIGRGINTVEQRGRRGGIVSGKRGREGLMREWVSGDSTKERREAFGFDV